MNTEQLSNKQRQLIVTFAALVVVVLVVFGARAFVKKNSPSLTPVATTSNTVNNSSANTSGSGSASTGNNTSSAGSGSSSSTAQTHTYKDGTYSAQGNYDTPDGEQAIAVTLVIKNDVVSASQVQPEATRGDSAEFQAAFVQNYQTYVVGKRVSDIHLSRVSGSSLTSGGFNSALEQIKSQAHA